MKKLHVQPLPIPVQKVLDDLQSEINVLPNYADQVAKGKLLWNSTSRKVTDAKVGVRRVLTVMNGDLCRCSYCEDSCADEIEHIHPKDLYPEFTFVWNNYLYSCGPCNGPKNNKFSVYDSASDSIIDVTRKRNAPITPPHPGEPLLINPRKEDPLVFLTMDLLETFYFLPRDMDEDSISYKRAEYTIKILNLNSREALRKARQSEFNNYYNLLKLFIFEKEKRVNKERLDSLKVKFVLKSRHPTVWEEMKRQHTMFPELNSLFQQAPEALLW